MGKVIYKCKSRFGRRNASSLPSLFLLLSISLGSLAPTAIAAPYPGTGAPVSCSRQVSAETGSDPTNPYSYPFLVDIAKSLAKNGFPASFFLGADSPSGRGPGIDLRTLLLYETGILKSPVKFFVPQRKQQRDSSFPSLSMDAIPESPGGMPGNPPVLKSALDEQGIKDSDNAKSVVRKDPVPEKDKNPALSLDMNKFSIDIAESRLKNELTNSNNKVSEELGNLAMAQPVTLDLHSNANHEEDLSFHFWTVPQAIAPPKIGETSQSGEFRNSSFVMMSPTGLKSVLGRIFTLNQGQMLASSLSKSIFVETPVAKVSIEPGSSAFVEVVNPKCIRVRVFSCKDGARSVSVKFKSAGKGEDIRLGPNEDLIVSDQNLTDVDKALQAKTGTASSGINWTKTTFSAKALFDSDSFFSTDTASQNAEQRKALMWLRKQVK